MDRDGFKDLVGMVFLYGDIENNPRKCAVRILEAADQYAEWYARHLDYAETCIEKDPDYKIVLLDKE
jgi:hypothetical protein